MHSTGRTCTGAVVNPERSLLVHYEDIVAKPYETIMCAYVGLDDVPHEILDDYTFNR